MLLALTHTVTISCPCDHCGGTGRCPSERDMAGQVTRMQCCGSCLGRGMVRVTVEADALEPAAFPM